ncbi:MAG: hypothetical protein FJ296_10250 [Planctomycetes bacterium]|nr:hypothetical protein [Planctomycetota bacterium]
MSTAAMVLGFPFAASAEVWVVSKLTSGPEVDFFHIQDAVDAASDGDVVLVLAGGNSDAGVVIEDKSLVLQGVPGAGGERPRTQVLRVNGLQAGKSLIVRDLEVKGFDLDFFEVMDCAGAVLFEDCLVEGSPNSAQPPAIKQPIVEQSSRVVFTRCELIGAQGLSLTSSHTFIVSGGPGLVVEDSTVTLYDCTVAGGDGQDAFFYLGLPNQFALSTPGGQGVQVWSGTLNVIGSDVRGGQGGDGDTHPLVCLPPAKGGTGIRSFAAVQRLDAVVEGGEGGAGTPCSPADADDGNEIVLLTGGSVTTLAQDARHLEVNSPLEDGANVAMDIRGLPGEVVVLLQSLQAQGTWLSNFKGTLAGAAPYALYFLGPLGPDGRLLLEFPLPAGALPAGLESLTIIDQCLAAAAGGGAVLSSPTLITLVHDVP